MRTTAGKQTQTSFHTAHIYIHIDRNLDTKTEALTHLAGHTEYTFRTGWEGVPHNVVSFPTCRLLPSTGTASSLPGRSCKHIKDTLANQCSQRPQSGIYWVKVTEQCSAEEQTMQVSEVEEGAIQTTIKLV